MTGNENQTMPRIGITASLRDIPPVGAYLTGRDYVLSTKMAGGCPLLLPTTDDVQVIAQYVASIDGLLLTGGEDVDPSLYGEEPKAGLVRIDRARDDFEIELLQEAVTAGKRVLAICRGLQVVNVAFGGTLVQDIPTEMEGCLHHFGDMKKRSEPIHSISVKEDSYLYSIMGTREIDTNSFHHQAIKDLAPGFFISAWAPDGIIEAIEAEDKGIVAVQFHPENMTVRFPVFLRLFADLVNESRTHRTNGRI